MATALRVAQRSGRHYKIDGYERLFPSVTTVLGVINKPALVSWSNKVTLSAVRREILSLQHPSSNPRDWLDPVLERAGGQHKEILRNAGDFGTRAHAAFDSIITGVPAHVSTDDDALETVVNGFRAWHASSDLQLQGDTTVFSEKYGYAGAMDSLGVARGDDSLAVVDFKTSNGIYETHILQVAAYAKAYEEMHGTPVSRAMIVRFDKKQPTFEVQQLVDIDASFRAFQAALFLWRTLNTGVAPTQAA